MIKKSAVLFFLVYGTTLPICADKVVLREDGKIIHGKIIKEDAAEVSIRLNGNMFLRVEKTKIKEIIREAKAPERNTVTMQTIRASSATAPATPSATSAPVVEKPALRNVKADFSTTRKEKGAGASVESVRVQTYSVMGNDFDAAKNAILAREGGKGFLNKGRRMPSKTDLALSWDGKTRVEGGKMKWAGLVMASTITVTYPEWKAPPRVNDASVRDWNTFITELLEHDQGHADIYQVSLRELAETLTNLEAANEESLRATSKTIVAQWRVRTEKKQDGHDRREKEKSKTDKKEP